MFFDVLQSIGASRIFSDRSSRFGVTRFFSPARKSGKPRLLQIFLTRSNPCRRFTCNGWGGFAVAIFSDFGFAGFRGLGVAVEKFFPAKNFWCGAITRAMRSRGW